MENHYFDERGTYTASAPANPGSEAPDNALRVAPPRRDGHWPVLNAAGDGWDLAEDHRGRAGWLNGERRIIDALGPLPEGWSDEPPPAVDDRTPEERREDDYRVEADPLRDAALSYRAEAEAWLLAGDRARAGAASAKAADRLRRYLEVKEAIRGRHPATGGETAAAVPLFYLTNAGTVHAEGCAYTAAAGEWLSLAAIRERNPGARACGRCYPRLGTGRA